MQGTFIGQIRLKFEFVELGKFNWPGNFSKQLIAK
jgi:hypothetical protein